MKASELLKDWPSGGQEREDAIIQAYRLGNVVRWPAIEVLAVDARHAVTFYAVGNYFAIGDETDFVFMPMSPLTAQRICDLGNFILPTRRIVDLIWGSAPLRVEPQPWGPPFDASMCSNERYVAHSTRVTHQLDAMAPTPWQEKLVAGYKKDLVLTNHLDKDHVAIYGWHHLSGTPIQPLNCLSHAATYADYSHGVRFILQGAYVDGSPRDMESILADPTLAHLVSDEGVMRVLRHPGVPIPVESKDEPVV